MQNSLRIFYAGWYVYLRSWPYPFRMPLSAEFRRHLHDVMVEVAEFQSDSQAKCTAELLGKARATHNRDAIPIAYKDAALHALRTRFESTIERYFRALSEWGIRIGDDEEREMLTHICALTSGPNQLHFPRALRLPNESAYQGDYARSREKLVHELQLSAKNKLREIKMRGLLKAHEELREAQRQRELRPPVVNHHYTATGPNARVTVGSVDNSTNSVQPTPPLPSTGTVKKEGWEYSDSVALVLFCLSCVLALVLFWAEKTPVWAGVTIMALAVLMVYPVWHVCRTWVQRTLALVVVWALLAFFGWKIWPHLTPKEGIYTLAPGAILVPGKYPHNGNVEPPAQSSTPALEAKPSVEPDEAPPRLSPPGRETKPDANGAIPPRPEASSANLFDSRLPAWKLKYAPSELTLHDLFLSDFPNTQQVDFGEFTIDDAKTVKVQYGIGIDLGQRAKSIHLYIAPQPDHTAAICSRLAKIYKWVLENAPAQMMLEEKTVGDSSVVKTKDAIFTGRVYVYHETYLDAETTVRLTKEFEADGASVIFRSVDYASNKRNEAMLNQRR